MGSLLGLVIVGTKGTIEMRKYIDIGGENGTDHLFLIDNNSVQRIDCAYVDLPYGRQVVQDVLHRTESAMPQARCFKAMELALTAQAMAEGPPPGSSTDAITLAQTYRGTGNAELPARAMQPFGIDVTQREHAELIRQDIVTLGDMVAPDTSADDSDIPDLRHTRPSAIACAVRASSIALKQRA